MAIESRACKFFISACFFIKKIKFAYKSRKRIVFLHGNKLELKNQKYKWRQKQLIRTCIIC